MLQRSRRAAGLIEPCLPSPATGPDWLHEIKHDGLRILAGKRLELVNVWSCRGADFTYRFPAIAEAARGT